MLIAIVSDLHLEHSVPDLNVILEQQADVLVMAGDIVPYEVLPKRVEFFDAITAHFKHIIYVLGNHEFYGACITSSFKSRLACYPNLHVLEDECVTIDGVDFFGGTMWTDYRKQDPITLQVAQQNMADYRAIRYDSRRITPNDIYSKHTAFISALKDWLTTSNNPKVVVTHHSPLFETTADEYKDDYYMNGLFASDLSEIIINNNIDYWIYGHMHSGNDVLLSGCNVITNPRGYPGEVSHWTFKMRYINYENAVRKT